MMALLSGQSIQVGFDQSNVVEFKVVDHIGAGMVSTGSDWSVPSC